MHPSAICFFLSIITRFIYVDTYKHIKNLIVYIYSTHMSQYTYPLLNGATLS